MVNFEKIVGSIQRQLILNDPACNQASFLLLTNILEIDEEAFLIRLVDSGIISNVIRIIGPETQGNILKSIEIITNNDVFYKNDLVNETITSITKCDFTQSQEEATAALNILYKVVTKVFEFNESQGASLIQKHADGLLSFFTQPAFDQCSLLSATKLFNFIIKYSAPEFKQTNFSNIGYIYRLTVDHLLSLEVGSALDIIRTICCISTSVIREIGIPEGLRNKVIHFWIDRSNTDQEFDAFIKECLNQGYSELKIIKLLMGFVHENCMEHLDNVTDAYGALLRYRDEIPEDVVVFVLKTLADDLASYTPSNSHMLKIVLRFSCSLPTSNSVSTSILRMCAINIGKILVQEGTDFVLKALLITQASFTIRHSLSVNDSKVAEIFLRNDEFLGEVFKSGFFSKGITMARSIRTLICLIFCQIKFNLQCKSVSQVTFKDLQTLLIKMRENGCNQMLGVELIKLLLINTVNNPLIVLYTPTKFKHLSYMLEVYFLIHIIHDESQPGKEEQTYECLSAMLDYTFAQKFNINILLICAGTPDLVEIATDRILKSNQLNLSFLDFATKWLTYRQGFRQHVRMKIKSFAEKSADILIGFRPQVDHIKNESCVIVDDFCTAVDNYFKNFYQ
ncbi:uncharacterized protein LOC117178309 isoform X2 [Belonocnema kinseyi]|uniref:uncharacterized protein LOC117178309 isoform X2 n=1 Tax=Belonocnema kinseyi TaxID=2817044 RepID=UPI00143D9EAE|nr:uncharacterized protein LOC117178309 isoform X2 [Belonocnema kinseyi]